MQPSERVECSSIISASLVAGLSGTQIKLFKGAQIGAEVHSLSHLVAQAFLGYPYLYETAKAGGNEAYIQERYVQYPESVVFIAYQEGKAVGAAMGVPLDKAPEHYQEPFKCGEPLVLSEYFYFGELMVLAEAQNHKVAHDLYIAMWNHVRHSHFKAICFASVDRTPGDPLYAKKPADYINIPEILGTKHSFAKRDDLPFSGKWTIHGETEARVHPMVFWWRDITPADRA